MTLKKIVFKPGVNIENALVILMKVDGLIAIKYVFDKVCLRR